jgi:hypothetical protein
MTIYVYDRRTLRKSFGGWGCRSVVELLPSICKDLDSMLIQREREKDLPQYRSIYPKVIFWTRTDSSLCISRWVPFFSALGFELSALGLLVKHSTTWTVPPSLGPSISSLSFGCWAEKLAQVSFQYFLWQNKDFILSVFYPWVFLFFPFFQLSLLWRLEVTLGSICLSPLSHYPFLVAIQGGYWLQMLPFIPRKQGGVVYLSCSTLTSVP